jgi:hypothetical protein
MSNPDAVVMAMGQRVVRMSHTGQTRFMGAANWVPKRSAIFWLKVCSGEFTPFPLKRSHIMGQGNGLHFGDGPGFRQLSMKLTQEDKEPNGTHPRET